MSSVNWRVSLQIALGLTLSFLFFYMMSPFLIAIFLGAVIAMVCFPMHAKLRKRMPAALAALIVTIALSLGLFFPIFAILYSVSFKILSIASRFQFSEVNASISSLLRTIHLDQLMAFVGRFLPLDDAWIVEQSGALFEKVVARLSQFVGATLAGAPTVLLGITVTIVTLYFLLLDGGRFIRFLWGLSPLERGRAKVLFGTFETSCRGVVLGIFLSGVAQGFLIFLLFLICGLPNALLMGSITIILGMVPLIGSSPIWIGATVYLFVQAHPFLAIAMLCGGVAVSAVDNIVRSMVMSEQSELHPLLALVSVFGAVNLFGAAGILLGPIIAAVFVAFLKILSMEMEVGA